MRSIEHRLRKLEEAARAARRIVLDGIAHFYPTFRDSRAHTAFYGPNVPPDPPEGLQADDLVKYETGRQLRQKLDALCYPNQEEPHA